MDLLYLQTSSLNEVDFIRQVWRRASDPLRPTSSTASPTPTLLQTSSLTTRRLWAHKRAEFPEGHSRPEHDEVSLSDSLSVVTALRLSVRYSLAVTPLLFRAEDVIEKP